MASAVFSSYSQKLETPVFENWLEVLKANLND